MRTPDFEKRIDESISAAFTENNEMLGRWILLAEVIGLDGGRAVWMLAAEGQQAWEMLGLIRFADHVAGTAVLRDESGEDGELP